MDLLRIAGYVAGSGIQKWRRFAPGIITVRADEQTQTPRRCHCSPHARVYPFLASLSTRPIRVRAALLVSKNNVWPDLLTFLPVKAVSRSLHHRTGPGASRLRMANRAGRSKYTYEAR